MQPKGAVEANKVQDQLSKAEGPETTRSAAGNLLVLTGPSGVGKGTVVKGLLDGVPGICRSVSVTTRSCRPGEQEGVDYFFRSSEEFERMRHADELLESAEFAGSF